jgi:hypothetical protein
MRCFRLYWPLTPTLVLLLFGFTSACREQLQQRVTFSELSKIINLRFACQLLFFGSPKLYILALEHLKKSTIIRAAQKYQNIVTLENERGALSSWCILVQLQWLGFGLPVGP